MRLRLHGGGRAAHVHEDDGHAGGGCNRAAVGVGGECRHIVDERGACGHGGLHDGGLHRVDRDRNAGLDQPLDHRQNAPKLRLERDGRCPGAGAFTTDIDQGGPGGVHRKPRLDCSRRIGQAAAIREAVGRDVEDAEDLRDCHHAG